jgi:hypothetical protein
VLDWHCSLLLKNPEDVELVEDGADLSLICFTTVPTFSMRGSAPS